jgi:hypothetical protein
MAQTLRLEYACTSEEMKQAQSLVLRKQVGGGSKWLTTLVLLAALTGMLFAGYFRIRREVAPKYQPLVYAALFLFVVAFVLWRRKLRKTEPTSINVDVSENDLTISRPGSNVSMPWSAFSECVESPELFVLRDRPKTMLFVIPKRAFPSESWLNWFCELTTRLTTVSQQTPITAASAAARATPANAVKLRVQIEFRDYIDRTLASCFTWGFLFGVVCLWLGVAAHAAAHPSPRAVYSTTQMFFMFVLPSIFVMMAFLILVGSVHSWLTHSKHSPPQEVALSEESIVFSGRDASGTLPWTAYPCYRETPWSFILWNPSGGASTMLPKRAFTTSDDVQRCRDLLARHLRRSWWFIG